MLCCWECNSVLCHLENSLVVPQRLDIEFCISQKFSVVHTKKMHLFKICTWVIIVKIDGKGKPYNVQSRFTLYEHVCAHMKARKTHQVSCSTTVYHNDGLVLINYEKQWNSMRYNTDEAGRYWASWRKPGTRGRTLYSCTFMKYL